MNAIKGIYTDGNIELIEKPVFHEPVEVLIIFPKSEKKLLNCAVYAKATILITSKSI